MYRILIALAISILNYYCFIATMDYVFFGVQIISFAVALILINEKFFIKK